MINVGFALSKKIGICVSFETISDISNLLTSENLKKPTKLRIHKRVVPRSNKVKFIPPNILYNCNTIRVIGVFFWGCIATNYFNFFWSIRNQFTFARFRMTYYFMKYVFFHKSRALNDWITLTSLQQAKQTQYEIFFWWLCRLIWKCILQDSHFSEYSQ